MEGIYKSIIKRSKLELDIEKIKAARPVIVEMLREHGVERARNRFGPYNMD